MNDLESGWRRSGPGAGRTASWRWIVVSACVALVSVGCAGAEEAGGPAMTDEAGPEGTEGATAEEMGSPVDPAALEDPSRTDDDRYRDGGFKPLEVYGFFGVEAGMAVADLWPGGGYNTHILANVVGDDGRVLSVLGPLYLNSRYEERVRQALAVRIEGGGLDNVEVLGPLEGIEDGTVDVAITVRNYHDLGDAAERTAVLPGILRILKPGGVLGVVDAYSPEEGVDEENHRINEELVVEEITGAGFELVGRSDVLVNPEDTYDFDGREDDAPIHRYFIHRFVHKYRKPSESMD